MGYKVPNKYSLLTYLFSCILQTLNNEVKKCLSNFEVKSKECYQLTEQIESLNATITQLSEKVVSVFFKCPWGWGFISVDFGLVSSVK